MAESRAPAPAPRRGPRRIGYLALVAVTTAATIAVLMLLQNIFTRKREAEQVVFKLVDIDETVADPAEWGKNFPRQYDGYRRTVDMNRTRYGGSEADPFATAHSFSRIEEDPRLKTMWAGYAFATDFREERGHAYMLVDQRDTQRVRQFNQPGACLHCHASVISAYRKVGLEDGAPGDLKQSLTSAHGIAQMMAGFEKVCAMPYADATGLVDHPVACVDCHDPQSMQLRVTRPGFLNGIRALAGSSDPVPHLPSIERWRSESSSRPYDPNALATRQEMRSFVCGQCHVEYYFKGEGKLLTYPWFNGLKVQQIEKHYDDIGFKDWTHALTGADVLKAQHPEFETWSQGIHARSGVACADCHMPYMRQGAIKISDHHVRSPLLNINNACQTCHRTSEEELLARATTIQDRTRDMMNRAQNALNDLIPAIEAAMQAGATDEQLLAARQLQRRAQFRVDFVNAENSMGFHADQETARTLAEAIDYARQGIAQTSFVQSEPQAARE
jgi:nitrite reductase (cytochrome c-552)